MGIIKNLIAEKDNTIKTNPSVEPTIDKTIQQLQAYLDKLYTGEIHSPNTFKSGSNKNKAMTSMLIEEIEAIKECIASLQKARSAVYNCELYSKTFANEQELGK